MKLPQIFGPQKNGHGKNGRNGKSLVKRLEMRVELNPKNLLLYGLTILMLILSLVSLFGTPKQPRPQKNFSEILVDAKAGKIEKISVAENELTVKYKDGAVVGSRKGEGQDLARALFSKDELGLDPAQISLANESDITKNFWVNTFLQFGPIVLFFFLLSRLYQSQMRGANSIFSMGQSTARVYTKDQPKISFTNVAGVDEAKRELEEIVDFLKNPKKYAALGARTPKGVLLIGPSGCGKTLLARAVAGEAKVPFFSVAGSEFMEMLVGVGASRVRDLFQTAKKSRPAIIFIDEIDAIGRARSIGVLGGHDEREQTLNQILIEMDGFEPNEQVVVMAASNRGDLLDPALRRPGRFDRTVVLDLPDKEGRLAILEVHKKNKPFVEGLDWEKAAKRTVGFSGADLENMLNEAAILAARAGRTKIEMGDIEEAATKVKLGPQKKRLQSDFDKKMTAYHEAGHALVTHFLPHMDPVHRISIVSRGMSLGHTLIPPAADRLHETKSHLTEQIASMMGGRAAEAMIFNEMTTGAASDIQQATAIAREMVMEFGMSVLGPVNFDSEPKNYLGRMFMEPTRVSEEMAAKIDAEVKQIIGKSYKLAVNILKKHRAILDKIAKALVVKETLEGEEFEKIVGAAKVKISNG